METKSVSMFTIVSKAATEGDFFASASENVTSRLALNLNLIHEGENFVLHF